jgi:hypothetical protein
MDSLNVDRQRLIAPFGIEGVRSHALAGTREKKAKKIAEPSGARFPIRRLKWVISLRAVYENPY